MKFERLHKLRQAFWESRELNLRSVLFGIVIGASGMWATGFFGELGRRAAEGINQTNPISSLSTVDYFQRVSKLKNDFLALKEYKDGLVGLTVKWDGAVGSVSEHKSPFPFFSSPSFNLNLTPLGSENLLKYIFVDFDYEWRTKLYSLRPGDLVKVHGKIEEAHSFGISLKGINLELIPKSTTRFR